MIPVNYAQVKFTETHKFLVYADDVNNCTKPIKSIKINP